MVNEADKKLIEDYYNKVKDPLDPDRIAAVYERVQERMAHNLRYNRAALSNDDYIILMALQARLPMQVKEIHCDEYCCPACGAKNMADEYKVGDKFCPECGQKIVQKSNF